MKKLIISTMATFLLIGCGGGASTTESVNNSNIDNNNSISSSNNVVKPSDVNVTKAIQDGKVLGYSDSNTEKENYLAVINYLRSLKIECGDTDNTVGPASALNWSDKLYQASLDHSKDVVKNYTKYFNPRIESKGYNPHLGSGTSTDIPGFQNGEGSRFTDRIQYNNYQHPLGENVAITSDTEVGDDTNAWLNAMNGLIRSPEHCRNIMSPYAKDFGMAEYVSPDNSVYGEYHYFWTQDFGSSEN